MAKESFTKTLAGLLRMHEIAVQQAKLEAERDVIRIALDGPYGDLDDEERKMLGRLSGELGAIEEAQAAPKLVAIAANGFWFST